MKIFNSLCHTYTFVLFINILLTNQFYQLQICLIQKSLTSWTGSPNNQYHIQTDEGPERYFKYQTQSGQYRKEKRLQDGTVVGKNTHYVYI